MNNVQIDKDLKGGRIVQKGSKNGIKKAARKCLKWGVCGGVTEDSFGVLAVVSYCGIMVYKRFSMG